MPVYNGGSYLRPAILSILNQDFEDFELLIIDDGSIDASMEVANSFNDPRIRIEPNGKNLGLITSLNRGLDLAKGEYVARMDADDIAFPKRLSTQVAFMESHPDIGLCGTWYERESSEGTVAMKPPVDDQLIRFFLIFDTVFTHSTILLRRSFFENHHLRYDPAYIYAEDFDLWTRCALHMRLANIPEVLLLYQDHADNTSNRHKKEQVFTADKVRCRYLETLELQPTANEYQIHNDLIQFRLKGNIKELEAAGSWLIRLAKAAETTLDLPSAAIFSELSRYWYGACAKHADNGLEAWRIFLKNPAGQQGRLIWKAKLLARCFLKRPAHESRQVI